MSDSTITDYSFMNHYERWWSEVCLVCSYKADDCSCKEDWEDRVGVGSIPKSWAWIISAKDFDCYYCTNVPSTYDCCCGPMGAYLKYRWAAIWSPTLTTELFTAALDNGADIL